MALKADASDKLKQTLPELKKLFNTSLVFDHFYIQSNSLNTYKALKQLLLGGDATLEKEVTYKERPFAVLRFKNPFEGARAIELVAPKPGFAPNNFIDHLAFTMPKVPLKEFLAIRDKIRSGEQPYKSIEFLQDD